MSINFRALALSSVLVCLCACSEQQAKDAQGGVANATEHVKEGAAKAGAVMATSWDSMSAELGKQSEALKTALAKATPEAKAKLQALVDSFQEHMATAKAKFEEAKTAAPEKAEALMKQGQAAVDAAKKAYNDAIN